MARATFGRNQRLLVSRQFKAVFDDAPLRVAHQHMLLLARPNGLGHSRIGLVIPKKVVRCAVSRNRIKRVVRDTFRLRMVESTALDIVFLARRGLDVIPCKEQTALLRRGWQRLDNKLRKVKPRDR